MTFFPFDELSRMRRREQISRDAHAQADRVASRTGRSSRCADGDHAPRGCRNTGATCICHCHDQKESRT